MTKAEYIDFVRNSLQMVDKTSKFLRPQVEAAINNAINTVFYELYQENPKVMMKSLERYSSQETVTPTLTTFTNRYTDELSSDVVDLPKKAGGILEIIQQATGLPKDTTLTTTYVPVSTMEGEQMYGSEASLPGNVVGFSWSGARDIEFWGLSAAEAVASSVVRFIKQFKSYASTDNVVLPFGQDDKIMQLVREYLGVIPPKDITNNNADG